MNFLDTHREVLAGFSTERFDFALPAEVEYAMRGLAATLVFTLSLSGCASFIIRPEDSVGKKSAKVAGRVFGGLATLGVSEIAIAGAKNREEDQRRQLEAIITDSKRAERFAQQLREAKTVHQLSTVLGTGPQSCVPASATHQVCTWVVGQKQSTYVGVPIGSFTAVLPIESGTVHTIICELPLDGSPREEGSCSISAR